MAARRTLPIAAALLTLIAGPGREAGAAGFAIPQQSVQGLGRAQAGNAAAAQDPSTVYFNPAGMTELDQPQASLGTNLIMPRIEFSDRGSTAATPATGGVAVPYPGSDGGNPGSLALVPNAYAVQPVVADRVWVGVALTAPFGLSAKYNDDWFGRYDSIKSELRTYDFGSALAVKINEQVSIGGGLNVQYADAELTNAIPNPLEPGGPTPATDGLFRVSGDDLSIGYNIGLLLKPTPTTRVGLHYRSGMTHTLDGEVNTSLAGVDFEGDAEADLDLPPIAALAIAQDLGSLTLLGEFTWYGWSSFEEIRVRFDDESIPDAVRETNYRDTFALAVGAEYQLLQELAVRAGFQYDRTPTRDRFRDTSLPDGDRYWLTMGLTADNGGPVAMDVGFSHVIFEDGEVDVERAFPAVGSTVRVRGRAETRVNTLAINLRWRF